MAEKTLIPRPLYNSINETVKELRIIQNVKKTAVKTVTYDPAKTDVARLKAAIEKLGYKVTVQES